MSRLIDADARVMLHEGPFHTEMSIAEVLDLTTDEGCPPTIDAIPVTWLEDIAGRYEYSGCTDSADVVMAIIEDWKKEQEK